MGEDCITPVDAACVRERHEQDMRRSDSLPRDLFFIDTRGLVYTYSPSDKNTWFFSRMPPSQKTKIKFVLCYRDGTWLVQNQSSAAKNEIHMLPANGAEQTQSHPPLGPWRSMKGGDQLTLSDREPALEPLKLPMSIEMPFLSVDIVEKESAVWITSTMSSSPITDALFEDVLSKMKSVLESLAQRPGLVMFSRMSIQRAAAPASRHVMRFMRWAEKEVALPLFLVTRASVIILDPKGVIGHLLLGTVKFVLRMLPPPWEHNILPTFEHADKWLAEQAAAFDVDSGSPERLVPALAESDERTGQEEPEEARIVLTCKASEEVSDIAIEGPAQSVSPLRAVWGMCSCR